MADYIIQLESVGGFSGANLFVSSGATFAGTVSSDTGFNKY